MNGKTQLTIIMAIHALAGSIFLLKQPLVPASLFLLAVYAGAYFTTKPYWRGYAAILSSSPLFIAGPLFLVQVFFFAALMLSQSFGANSVCLAGLLSAGVFRMRMFTMILDDKNTIATMAAEKSEMNSAFREVRAQRHDFLKHASALQHLLGEERFDEAQTYLSELVGDYQKVNASIQGEDGHIAAALLKSAKLAEAHNIKLVWDTSVPLSTLPLTPIDQSKLLANLLDNAVEAAIPFTEQHGYGTISLETALYGGIYILEITNTTLPLDRKQVDSLFRKFDSTTKQEGHEGLGTYIISSLIARHNGKLDYLYKPPLLSIKIKLPNLIPNGLVKRSPSLNHYSKNETNTIIKGGKF